MSRQPQTADEWAHVARRFWTVVHELIHHADAGRLVEAPGSSFNDRRSVRAYLNAVRALLADGPFDSEPADVDPAGVDDSSGGGT